MESQYRKNKEQKEKLLKTAEFLRAIAEENRLKILYSLKKGEQCVCNIWRYLKLPQNLTSHHLKVLKTCGLISSRKDGLRVFYSVDKKAINKHLKLLNKLLTHYEK